MVLQLTMLQNDCMLMMGRGKDNDGNLIDGNTVYVLEALRGIKTRALKAKRPDEALGIATAGLHFNLKFQYRTVLDTNQTPPGYHRQLVLSRLQQICIPDRASRV